MRTITSSLRRSSGVMTRLGLAVALALTVIWAPIQPAFAASLAEVSGNDLVVNGSFEQGIEPGASIHLNAPDTNSIFGWNIKAGNVDYIGSRWVAGEGMRCLDLNGTERGTVSQNVTGFTVGKQYRLTFLLAGNPEMSWALPSRRNVQVSVGIETNTFSFEVKGFTIDNLGWRSESMDFTASDSTLPLVFSSQTDNLGGPALDGISIQPLNTNIPPTIVENPKSQLVFAGTNIRLTVQANGTPPLFYNWFHNEAQLDVAEAVLEINNIQTNQNGSYYVVVSNFFGVATSQVATISVNNSTADFCQIVPRIAESEEIPFGSGVLRNSNFRVQEVYGADQFPPGNLCITEIRFRPDAFYGNTCYTTVSNIQIKLSTTSRSPENLSPAYAENVGKDVTEVFSGSLTVSSQSANYSGTPKAFDIRIPLKRTFLYNPSQGNLLVDVLNFSGSSATLVSGRGVTGDRTSRVLGDLRSATGVVDNGGDALQICFSTAPVAPYITSQPQKLTVVDGGSAQFTVTASGTPPLEYQWFHDGNALPGATSSVLELTNVQFAQAGSYWVTVINSMGAVTSQVAQLTVRGNLNCLILPESASTSEVPFGSGNLRNRNWRAQQVYAASQFPSGLLEINELLFRPDAHYGNAFNAHVENIRIILSTTPRQPDQLSSTFAENTGSNAVEVLNGAIDFSSQFRGQGIKDFDIRIPLTRSFFYNPREGHLLIDIQNFSGSTAALIAGGAIKDGVSRVTGNIGSQTGTVDSGGDALKLCVTVAPLPLEIISQPISQTAYVGDRVEFAVSASGTPPLRYQWYFENMVLSGATEASLKLTNIQVAQAGKYWAIVSDVSGNATSQVAMLTVENSPGDFCKVVPEIAETTEIPFGSGVLRHGNFRSQQVYGAALFPARTLAINEIRFRPDAFYGGAFTATISNIQISLSTTKSNPEELKSAFADNTGPDEVEVFNGSLNLSSQFNGPTQGPKAFDIRIPLSRRFIYNPALGNLLVDIRNHSGSMTTLISGRGVDGDGVSRVLGDTRSATGLPDNGGDALQICFMTTNGMPGVVSFDLSEGFSPTQNPNGPWSYGYLENLDGPFALVTTNRTFSADNGVPIAAWEYAIYDLPGVWKVLGESNGISSGGQFIAAPGTIYFAPGPDGSMRNYGAIRFTVPADAAGDYSLKTSVGSLFDGDRSRDADFHVLKNGQVLFEEALAPNSGTGYTNVLSLVAGDTVDFAIGRGPDGQALDTGLKISASLTLLNSNCPPATCIAPPTGLVGWWAFDGSATDLAGTNVGVVNGEPAFVSAKVEQGMNFDGVNDTVDVAASASLDVGVKPAMSIEAWVKPGSVNMQPIVEYAPQEGGPGMHFWIGVYGAGSLYANLFDVEGVSHSWRSETDIVKANQLQHVAMTYDKATGLLRFYLDGRKVTEHYLGTFTPLTSLPIHIGYRPAQERFQGVIDELSIYNRLLTDGEIAAVVAAGSSGKCKTGLPPIIVQAPQSQSVVVGSTVSFEVQATGTAPLSYQWLYNGLPLESQNQSVLTLANVGQVQAGAYTVVVTNLYGNVTSAAANLTVSAQSQPPVITAQPQSQSVLAGANVTFTVSVSGTGPFSYQWAFNGNDLPGATNRTLLMQNVTSANVGNYQVSVANQGGAVVSAVAALTLQTDNLPPSIIDQADSQVVQIGDDVNLWVTASGSGQLFYQWRYNGQAISEATNSALVVTNAQLAQAGTYSVVINNQYGSVTSSGYVVNVCDAPGGGYVMFANSSTTPVYDVDQTTKLMGPAYRAQLYAGSSTNHLQPVGSAVPFSTISPGRFLGGNIVIPFIAGGQSGWFEVRVWETAYGQCYEEARANGSKTGKSGILNGATGAFVPTPLVAFGLQAFALEPGGPVTLPEITEQPQSQTVSLGSMAIFRVAATGTAPLRYKWLLNGEELPGATGTTLVITNAHTINAGDYTVVVRNAGGAVTSQAATLTVEIDRLLFVTSPAAQAVGEMVSVPLTLISHGDVAGMTFVLHYNPDYLTVPEVVWDAGLEGALKQAHIPVPGQLRGVFAFGSSTVAAGTQAVAVVNFRARMVPENSSSDLRLELIDVANLAGDPILFGSAVENGSVTVNGSTSTDNNGNNRLDAGDATLLLRLLARLDTMRPWDLGRNDYNNNGSLDSGDIVKLLQAIAAVTDTTGGEGEIPVTLASAIPAPPVAEAAVLSPMRLRGTAGQTVTVQVKLENIRGSVSAASFTLNYPATALRLTATRLGTMVPAGAAAAWRTDTAGQARLVVSSPEAWLASSGILAEVSFEVLPAAADQFAWPMTLRGIEITADGYAPRYVMGVGAALIGRDPAPGRFTQMQRSGDGQFRFRLNGEAGAEYLLEVSSDLVNWTLLNRVQAGSEPIEVVDPQAVDLPKRFYRLRPEQ